MTRLFHTALALLLMTPAHVQEVEAYRRARAIKVTSDDGWLTVAGLFWLKPGANRFGSAPDCDIVLPRSAPPQAGVFDLTEGAVTVTLGKERRSLKAETDVVSLGRLRMLVIERDGRMAVRLRDLDAPARRTFKGLRWFPIRSEYRITGRFVPHAAPKRLPIPNILGYVERLESPGVAVFTLGGKEHRLDAVYETDERNELFFIFRDRTAGHETYGAGRMLYAPLPRDGQVVLDFNQAFTPPCGFTRFATCPLPPTQNRLAVRIEAGELNDSVE